MKVDRATFLALTTTLAAGTACSTAPPPTDTAGDEVVQQDAPACFANADDSMMPYTEGTCVAIQARLLDLEYEAWIAPSAEGPTLAESLRCTPYSYSHPAVEGTDLCPMWAARSAYKWCQVYARQFKRQSAEHALACLERITALPHAGPVYDCGFEALSRSCGYHPTAEGTCAVIETALVRKGVVWSPDQRDECMILVSGLRASARAQLEARAMADDPWYSLHSAIEGLEPD